MDPALAVPEEVEVRVLGLVFGRDSQADADTGIRALCNQYPSLAPAIEHLARHLLEQIADMQRRLGSVWQLSRSEGRYQIIDELGRGGLGTVSIARDRLLGRRVALKTIHPRHGASLHEIDPIKVHRFLDEAQIAAQLQHPGIPPVHDLGIGPSGVPFYTMRYVRGETLADWLGPDDVGAERSPKEVARVLLHVAEALDHAHGRQVLHRDIKPANVLVGRFGEVCVIDWGLARAIPGGSSAGPGSTIRTDRKVDLFSSALGTRGFVAPEQRRGEFHPASDVFSVAAILHQALLGLPPPLQEGQQHYELPRAAWRRDRRLAAICQRGVAPRLEHRYGTMAQLRDDLRAYLADRRPAACPPGLSVTALLLWRRTRRWWSGWRRLASVDAIRPRMIAGLRARRERRAATSAAPTQFTIATMFPAGRGATGTEARAGGRLAFAEQRLDAVRRLSTPSERFVGPTTIGRGGMAIVLRMEDGLLRRPVAVKVSRSDRQSGAPLLLDEAQIAAQLDHPAILSVHEIGVDKDGQIRMVMPLVAGGRLDQFLREQPRAWRTSARHLLQVAWGLAFAHQKGVVHRDIKPTNIVLGRHGDAYLADWGIALLIGAPSDGESAMRLHRGPGIDEQAAEETVSEERGDDVSQFTTTVHGRIIGTPVYMAPESFAGDMSVVGPHSDVWSLGVVLYEILGGRHPYADRIGNGGLLRLRRILDGHAIPPLRRFAPKAARALVAVCERALQTRPEARFCDAADFAQALEQGLRLAGG